MKTLAVCFPFDLFGNAGTAAGAQLLADALRELLVDNRRETQPTRGRAYSGCVRLREVSFETLEQVRTWHSTAKRLVRQAWARGDFILWLAGNHLGVLPLYEQLADCPDSLAVQLDAHLDIFNLADCTEELSHGNFLRHASALPPIINVGHRDLFLPANVISEYYTQALPIEAYLAEPDAMLVRLRQRVQAATGGVLLDIDCDVFDPAYFPAVGHPQPFGLTPQQLLRLADVVAGPNLRALAISEFLPAADSRDQSLRTLVWLIEWLLLRRYEVEPAKNGLSDNRTGSLD